MRCLSMLMVAVVITLGGCGKSTPKLTAHEETRVADIEYYFVSTVLDSSHYTGTLHGVDYLIDLCRRKATAKYKTNTKTRTIKQVVEDGANELRQYQPDLAHQLDRVLDDGCK